MTPERPRPDLDHTREALRRHDERVEEDEELEEGSSSDDEEASGSDEDSG